MILLLCLYFSEYCNTNSIIEDKFSFEAYYEDDLKKHETTIYVSIRPLSIDASAEDESITDIRFYIK